MIPVALRSFLLHLPSPAGLVFDLEGMKKNALEAKLRFGRTKLSFAVKSFPHPGVIDSLLPVLDGADVSNFSEYRLLNHLDLKPDFALWLTRCPLSDFEKIVSETKIKNIWYTVEDFSQVPRLLELKKKFSFSLSVRVNLNSIVPPGHPLHYDSRFGIDPSKLSEFPGIFEGVHCHHSSQKNDASLLELLLDKLSAFPGIRTLNLGGGWNLRDKEIQEVAKKFPGDLTLEPGRSYSEEFGYGFCRIDSLKVDGGRTFLQGRLSPIAQLRWILKVSFSLFPGGGDRASVPHPIYLAGPSCFEDDLLKLSEGGPDMSVGAGDIIVIRNVSGYSYSWNRSFNGIEVPVYFLGEYSSWLEKHTQHS